MADTVYECMFLLNANTFAKNPSELSNAIEEIVKTTGAEMLVSRLWNEQKLAYSVKGHRKGVYWLTYFRVESTNMAKFNRACRLNDAILRHLAIKLEPRLVEPMLAIARGEVPPKVNADVDLSEADSQEPEVATA